MANLSYRVMVIGPNSLQNALFASFVESNSDWSCTAFDSVTSALMQHREEADESVTALLDCVGFSGQVGEMAVAAELERAPADWTVALFNLDRNSSLERPAIR